MKRKFLTRLLSLVMVLSLMPVGAFAAEDEPETEPESEEVTALGTSGESGEGNTPGTLGALVGEVREITSTGNVVNIETGKDKVTVTPVAPIPWSPANEAIGRTVGGCWIGIDIFAPDGIETPAGVKFRNYSNTVDRDWDSVDDDMKDGRYHMGAWGRATPEMFDQAKGKDLVYTWYFNWDGNDETGVTIPAEDFIKPTGEQTKNATEMKGVDQIVTLTFNPYAVTLLGDDNKTIVWPLSTAPKVVLRKRDITLAPLTGGDSADLTGGKCTKTTYSMDDLTGDLTNDTSPIDIVLRAKNLIKHENGAGTEGYWVGFAVTLPDDLKGAYKTSQESIKVKAKFTATAEDAEKIESVDPVSLESNVDGAGNPGYTFYTNVGDKDQKKFATLQFVNRTGAPLTNEYKFNINTDGVHTVSYDISVKLPDNDKDLIEFAEDKYSYVVNVEKDQSSIILTTDRNASIDVNGKPNLDGIITLTEGVNTIEVMIGSGAGIKTYTIKVVKPSADSSTDSDSVTVNNPGTPTNGIVTATINEDLAIKAISNVKDSSSNTAIFNTKVYPQKLYSVSNVEVTLPALVNEALLNYDVPVKIETDLIDVTLTPEAIEQALTDGRETSKDLKLVVKKADVSNLPTNYPEKAVAVDVSIQNGSGKSVETSELTAPIKLTFPIPDELVSLRNSLVVAWFNEEDRQYEEIESALNLTRNTCVASTSHLSKFIMYAEPTDLLTITIGNETKTIPFYDYAATEKIGSVEYIRLVLPNGATNIKVTPGDTYEDYLLHITNSGTNQAVIEFTLNNKTYTLTLVRRSAIPPVPKVTWEQITNYSSDLDRKMYYGGKLTIKGLDPNRIYLVTFDNAIAPMVEGKVPRVTNVVTGEEEVVMSCQGSSQVIVWLVEENGYANSKCDIIFGNIDAKTEKGKGIMAKTLPSE